MGTEIVEGVDGSLVADEGNPMTFEFERASFALFQFCRFGELVKNGFTHGRNDWREVRSEQVLSPAIPFFRRDQNPSSRWSCVAETPDSRRDFRVMALSRLARRLPDSSVRRA